MAQVNHGEDICSQNFSAEMLHLWTKALNNTYGLNPGSKVSDGWDHCVGDILA
jgi:hypothetical protein